MSRISNVVDLIKKRAGHVHSDVLADLKSYAMKHISCQHKECPNGYEIYKRDFLFKNGSCTLKSLLNKPKLGVDATTKNLRTLLVDSVRKDAEFFERLDCVYSYEGPKESRNSPVQYSSMMKTNYDLEYRLLQYEGHSREFLDTVRYLLNLFKNGNFVMDSVSESKLHEICAKASGDSFIGPSYLSFLLSRATNLNEIESLNNIENANDLLKLLFGDNITNLDPSQRLNTSNVESLKPAVDEDLEMDVSSLLSSLRKKNSANSDYCDSETSKCAAKREDYTDILDHSQCNMTKSPKKDTCGDHKIKVQYLTCEMLAKFLNSDFEKIMETARQLGCNPENLDVEEAEFILDEIKTPNKIKFERINGFLTLEKVEGRYVRRPPVVAIVGHVDHGKTTILDKLQMSDIASGEVGMITQKLGAFQLECERGKLVFLDTPGHVVFGTMRSRGIRCTDLVILVVAADDGIMPQTVEAIELIKQEKVPFIVAINKIDISDGEHIEPMLETYGLVLKDVPVVYLSAKTGRNLDLLKDIIFDVSEALKMEADLTTKGQAYVFETIQHPTRGRCLNAIVRNGVIDVGSWATCGTNYSKIKRMFDKDGNTIKKAYPSQIVQIPWAHDINCCAGTFIQQVESQYKAQRIALMNRKCYTKPLAWGNEELNEVENVEMPPKNVNHISEAPIPEIRVIIRCGDQGGLDAVTEWIEKFNAEKRNTVELKNLLERGYISPNNLSIGVLLRRWNPIRVVSKRVGNFNQSDSKIAEAGNVSFLGFGTVAPDTILKPPIVRIHDVIYHLFSDLEKMYEFHFGPTHVIKQEARLKVTQLGTVTLSSVGKRQAIGTVVNQGNAKSNDFFSVMREGKPVASDLKVYSMQSSRRNVTELRNGDANNCIIFADANIKVKVGDEIIAYTKEPLVPLFGIIADSLLKC